MKKTKCTLSFLMLSGLLLMGSCKKEEPQPIPQPTSEPINNPVTITNSFTALVDGVEFNEAYYTGLESPGANSIVITATAQGNFPSIGLAFPNTITPGTYTFQGSFGSRRGIYNVSNSANGQYSASNGTGTLEIISHNLNTNEIEGKFSFVASPNMGNSNTNTYNITEGEFAIKYN